MASRLAFTLALVSMTAWGVVGSQAPQATLEVPWIEKLKPGAFEGETPLFLDVTYRVDATVLLPLLVASIPIISRDDVGTGSFAAWDYAEDENVRLRAYEFFAASFPERARGLNRLGFLREVVRLTPKGADWTAHFGVISANREETREAAERALEQNEDLQPYSIIDGLTRATQTENSVLYLNLLGQWSSAAALYDDVRPRWEGQKPDYTRMLSNPQRRDYGEPLGFLASLQANLHAVAAAVAGGEDPRTEHRYQAYVHNGTVLRFELRDVDRDTGRAERYAQAGWLSDPAALRRLEYRILDEHGDEIESFKLWVQLVAGRAGDRFAAPLVPIAFEFKPRSYLRLKAVRVASPDP